MLFSCELIVIHCCALARCPAKQIAPQPGMGACIECDTNANANDDSTQCLCKVESGCQCAAHLLRALNVSCRCVPSRLQPIWTTSWAVPRLVRHCRCACSVESLASLMVIDVCSQARASAASKAPTAPRPAPDAAPCARGPAGGAVTNRAAEGPTSRPRSLPSQPTTVLVGDSRSFLLLLTRTVRCAVLLCSAACVIPDYCTGGNVTQQCIGHRGVGSRWCLCRLARLPLTCWMFLRWTAVCHLRAWLPGDLG